MCVCVSSHQTVECVQIMRWWSSNLIQGRLRSLGSVANCYVLVYLTRPSLSSRFLISFRGGHPPPDPTPPPLTCLRTVSSAQLGVNFLRPRIPMPPAKNQLLSLCVPPLRPSLAPVMPSGFLSPPHPCCCQNIFHRDPHPVFLCLLPPQEHPDSLPSLVPCLLHTHIKNRPVGPSLRHCFLSPIHICP